MKIRIVTPAPAGSRGGNRVTALRWARILKGLGHEVVIEQSYQGGSCDLLVALHARRSFGSIVRFRRRHPGSPVVVALTGTDLYRDLPANRAARRSLAYASRLIVLQPIAIARLPRGHRPKARVIYQSVAAPREPARRWRNLDAKDRITDTFQVCVLGHMRRVKDPFRAALAARRLPAGSRIRVVQIGAAMSDSMADRARAESVRNPRYRWLGELPRRDALRILASSRLLVLSSRMEGGANVISEAIAASVPVLSSRIPGSVGLLGHDYPGYFPVGDTRALGSLLLRTETDPAFHADLRARCVRLAPLVDPARERRSWRTLLREIRRSHP